jgi:hypothetical protein
VGLSLIRGSKIRKIWEFSPKTLEGDLGEWGYRYAPEER